MRGRGIWGRGIWGGRCRVVKAERITPCIVDSGFEAKDLNLWSHLFLLLAPIRSYTPGAKRIEIRVDSSPLKSKRGLPKICERDLEGVSSFIPLLFRGVVAGLVDIGVRYTVTLVVAEQREFYFLWNDPGTPSPRVGGDLIVDWTGFSLPPD